MQLQTHRLLVDLHDAGLDTVHESGNLDVAVGGDVCRKDKFDAVGDHDPPPVNVIDRDNSLYLTKHPS